MARERRAGQPRRYGLACSEIAEAGLKEIKRTNQSAYQEIERFIEGLRSYPFQGYLLEKGELAGLRATHIARDRYRVVWEVDEEIRTVFVLHVGLRSSVYAESPSEPQEDESDS